MHAVHENGGIRLAVTGELDLGTADSFAAEVRRLSANGGNVLLDLSGVEFMDSRGLQALVSSVIQARRGDCQITLGPQLTVQVKRLMEITGAEDFLRSP